MRRRSRLTVGTILGGRYQHRRGPGLRRHGRRLPGPRPKLDQPIALKRIRPDRVSPERRETLRREIILSRKVTHENVCRVYDLVEIDGEEFVSMEYLPGHDASRRSRTARGCCPLGRGLAIAKGICGGLAAAHRIGVLHRDLKPENVIVGEDGTPRLMDFGIADRVRRLPRRGGRHRPGNAAVSGPGAAARRACRARGPTSTPWASFSTRCSRAAFRSTTTTRRGSCGGSSRRPLRASRRSGPTCRRSSATSSSGRSPRIRRPAFPTRRLALRRHRGVRGPGPRPRARRGLGHARQDGQAHGHPGGEQVPRHDVRPDRDPADHPQDRDLRNRRRARARSSWWTRAPDELVSQILEGGAVNPIRLAVGHGYRRRRRARRAQVVNIADAYQDARFDKRTDAGVGVQDDFGAGGAAADARAGRSSAWSSS